eukprot:scaffold10455_cov28-Prasinocladus_malaysianus.AAC.1
MMVLCAEGNAKMFAIKSNLANKIFDWNAVRWIRTSGRPAGMSWSPSSRSSASPSPGLRLVDTNMRQSFDVAE